MRKVILDKNTNKSVYSLFSSDNDLVLLRKGIKEEWLLKFKEGFKKYLKGEWSESI